MKYYRYLGDLIIKLIISNLIVKYAKYILFLCRLKVYGIYTVIIV